MLHGQPATFQEEFVASWQLLGSWLQWIRLFGCFSDRIMRGRSPAALNFINKACRKKVKPIKINNDKPISSNLNTGTWQIYRIIRAPIDKQQKYWLTSTSTSFVLSNSGLLAQHCGLRKRLQVTNMCRISRVNPSPSHHYIDCILCIIYESIFKKKESSDDLSSELWYCSWKLDRLFNDIRLICIYKP